MSRLGLGGLFLIVRRSLRQHALSTAVTVVSTGLATGLIIAVFSINAQTYETFTGGATGFDAVLGARGSQLQLVLNAVFHLETSPGNIPWQMYQAIRQDPRVSLAIPYAVGDNYHAFRIVGTTEEIFTGFEDARGRHLQFMRGGRPFDASKHEAVLGSFAAQRTRLGVGSPFHPYHGVVFNERMRHEDEYTVVGVLKPTNTPADRVVWIPIEGIYRMSGHVLRGTGEVYEAKPDETIPDEHKEVSAVMLKLKNPQVGFLLDQTINKQGKVATLAWPIGKVMAELFDKMGWVHKILALVAYLVVVVAAGSILASIYNSINERRREFAILRALGARRRIIFSAIVMEAAAIASLGAVFGYGVYAVVLSAAAVIVRAQTGVVLSATYLHPVLVLAPLGMILMGALAGIIPALKAYATDVATNLVPHS
jgi:putative ABC transport system permease protein